jgi:organic radical activating enzyme
MDLKEKVKKMGLRVTKDVKGKRVKLTKKELQAKLDKKKKSVSGPTLENQARDAKKFIKVCKMVLREAESNAPRVVRQRRSVVAPSPPPPPPPPPPMRVPPKPVINNARARLMANLRADLKRRGLAT